MRERRPLRVRIRDDGSLTVVDPDPSTLDLIRCVDPGFCVRQAPLPGFERPRVLRARAVGSGVRLDDLAHVPDECLWSSHAASGMAERGVAAREASRLDLKIELAHRMLRACRLCGLACAVDRTAGEVGRCGLGTVAAVYEAYLHVAEEPPINPALNLSLRGCGMRCRYCQQWRALSPRHEAAEELGPEYWGRLDLTGARSLAFVGGNPTESLPAVLMFLRAAPPDFALPVVWNSSGYDSALAITLLDGVCDAYVPDWKYGNEVCAERLGRAPGYTTTARAALEAMCRQGVPVFVRLLVLPGHAECCHLPALDLMAPWRERAVLNVLGQYEPDFLVRPGEGPLAHPVLPREVIDVRETARTRGFLLL